MTKERNQSNATNALLAVAAVLFVLCLFFAWQWRSARNAAFDVSRLSPEEAQALVTQFQEQVPGLFRRAWFAPEVGYTLKPGTSIQAFNDRFESNALGFRTGEVEKGEGGFRVLFLGDSWTYGMGVSEEEAFPHQFELLANETAGIPNRIEAWSLALPGYNTVNQIAALRAFFDRLRPNAVVLCPTNNDINSTLDVSAGGRLRIRRAEPGDYALEAKFRFSDSYLYRNLWRHTFGRIREAEAGLGDVPLFIFFTAVWEEALVHAHMKEAGVTAPYTILPEEYCTGKWRRPRQVFGHGTPEAYRIHARLVYDMVAPDLGWKPLDARVHTTGGEEVVPFRGVPPGDWEREAAEALRGHAAEAFPERFEAGSESADRQCWGGVDWKSGIMGRSAVVLVLRGGAATKLAVDLEAIPGAPSLYPMEIEIRIPSPSGGIRRAVTVDAGGESGAGGRRFEIPLPDDIEPGSAVDVMFQAPRVAVGENLVARSVRIAGIEQD